MLNVHKKLKWSEAELFNILLIDIFDWNQLVLLIPEIVHIQVSDVTAMIL